jgi:hypothetical protein
MTATPNVLYLTLSKVGLPILRELTGFISRWNRPRGQKLTAA